jgi:hypothetical protein
MIETKNPARSTRMQKFYNNLETVMHAIAQPLTILQVRFDKGLVDEMNVDQLRALIVDSAAEVERLSNLCGYMQGFVIAESTEPDLSEQDLKLMLGHVAEGMDLFFKEAGMTLEVKLPDGEEAVFVDQKRMFQALSRVLLVVYELSVKKDTIEFLASTSSEGARITIRNVDAYKALGKEAAFKMTLAETNIGRQGGRLTWTAEPFLAHIELQTIPSPHQRGLVG